MNPDEALDWLYNIRRFGPKRTLEPTKRFLELMGNPQKHFKTIHIGGTNGKGSTSAFTASMLEAAGYRVGLYTSPHLERFNERIKINGAEIPDSDVARLLTLAKGIYEEMLSYPEPMHLRFFDIITGICFKYFEEEGVDYGVIEVGLGGRLDATNILRPQISIITNIGYEHVNILGPTLEDIAFEKAGIIKENTPVVTGETKPNILAVFQEVADKLCAELIPLKDYARYERIYTDKNAQRFNLHTPRNTYEGLKIPLLGLHQIVNASTAITAIEALSERGELIPPEAVFKGLRNVYWPGRLEVINKHPMIVLDCAKDAEATEAVRSTVLKDLDGRRIISVVSISSDKNIEGMIKNIAAFTDHFIVTQHSVTYRAAKPEVIVAEIKKHGKSYEVQLDRVEAFRSALNQAGPDNMVLVIGSVYLAGDARAFYHSLFPS